MNSDHTNKNYIIDAQKSENSQIISQFSNKEFPMTAPDINFENQVGNEWKPPLYNIRIKFAFENEFNQQILDKEEKIKELIRAMQVMISRQ